MTGTKRRPAVARLHRRRRAATANGLVRSTVLKRRCHGAISCPGRAMRLSDLIWDFSMYLPAGFYKEFWYYMSCCQL